MSAIPDMKLPWVEKYRPTDLGQIVAHETARAVIDKFIANHNIPHLLFYGPPGTGKTTMAHAIATRLFGKNLKANVLELNASDDRGINVVREQIKGFAGSRTIDGHGFKVIILDECDAMIKVAQAALRRIMEKYSSNARFIMICNYPEKILPALRSRCTEFRFPPLPPEAAAEFLRRIADSEKLTLTEDGVQALLTLGIGDLRRSINLMQTTALATNGNIVEANIYRCAGYPLPEEIRVQLQNLLNMPLNDAVASLENLRTEQGLALLDIVRELHKQVILLDLQSSHLALILRLLADIEKRIADGASEKVQCAAIAAAFMQLRIAMSN